MQGEDSLVGVAVEEPHPHERCREASRLLGLCDRQPPVERHPEVVVLGLERGEDHVLVAVLQLSYGVLCEGEVVREVPVTQVRASSRSKS